MKKLLIIALIALCNNAWTQVFPFEGNYTIPEYDYAGMTYKGTFGDITIQNPDLLDYVDTLHCATDFRPEDPAVEIRSVMAGIVEDVYYEPGRKENGVTYKGSDFYGGQIVVRHENGMLSVYGRLAKVYVREGDTVEEGEAIGFLDQSFKRLGGAEPIGYHLHFELLIDPCDANSAKLGIEGLPIDPSDAREIVGVKSSLAAGVWSPTSHIGYRKAFEDGQGGQIASNFHRGIDITVPPDWNAPNIYAFASGMVHSHYSTYSYRTMAGEPVRGNRVYGGVIMIDHGDGLYTMYAHMVHTKGREGHFVEKGDYIGIMGDTGVSSGRHLHFQMNYDPLVWFRKNITDFNEPIGVS